jgi:hypothetical protein
MFKKYTFTKPLKLFRVHRFYSSYFNQGDIMTNRNLIVTLASVPFFANLFVLLAGNKLASDAATTFSVIGMLSMSAAFLTFILTQKSKSEIDHEREDLYRDIDAVYRHIDEMRRDLSDDIRDCTRSCDKTSCKK